MSGPESAHTNWRQHLYEVIFEADSPAGKAFDVALLIAIVVSIVAVSLESVEQVRDRFGFELRIIEWALTIAFTIEYVLRLSCVRRPMRYARSFFGIVDLLAILPTYISLLIPGSQTLIVIRALRLLRIFRVFKLVHFLGEADVLRAALRASMRKVIVFLGAVLTLVVIIGAAMHLIEGPEHGFTSIPESVYWAIVTMTTVGYGDIAPQTVAGKLLASAVMIAGYAIIAVPTGIVTVELGLARGRVTPLPACSNCGSNGHAPDAKFCRKCGAAL